MDKKSIFRAAAVWLTLGLLTTGQLADPQVLKAGTPWDAAAMDWPYWRGPEMNGISREKNIPEEWSPDKAGEDNLVWKSEELASRSTPIVMDGLLYTIVRDQPGTKSEGEKVVCVDAATGEKNWESRFNVYLSDVPDTRVGWSCVVGDPESKKVFALGVCGFFQCLDAKTGETLWSHSLSEEYGLLSTYGGRTNMPITYKNLVIISAIVIGWGDMAKPAHRFMAFDQDTGEVVWFEGTRLLPYDTTYSSPVLTSFDGKPAMVFGSGDGGIHAFQPETGKTIWTYNVSKRGINTTPVVVGDKVVCGHSEENLDTTKMGALFCLDGTKEGDITEKGQIWRNVEMFVGKSSPLVVDGVIYAPEDGGSLLCVDLETGKLLNEVRLGGPMRSSPLYVDGKIYLMTENGRWWVWEVLGEGKLKTLARARMDVGDSHGSPIVSHGRLYVPTNEALYCIAETDAEPIADPRPEPPEITPADENPEPAHVQVVPAETMLQPGDQQPYQVRLYNKLGQFLGLAGEKPYTEPVRFDVEGVGRVKDGKFIAPAKDVTDAGLVTAKYGELSGSARVRVIPPFPWNYDFDKGQIPVTWVGIRYRHVPVDFDLWQKLKKENPKAGDLYLFLTSSFVNSGQDSVTFDDSTPRKSWTDLMDFMNLEGAANKLEDAKSALDPLLQTLNEEGVVAAKTWDTWSKTYGEFTLKGVRLTVKRGPRKIEGNGVMMKITTIPKGTRSQGWMGPADQGNFTIEADVYANERQGKLPDIGLEGQRYILDMKGASQELQIRTWTAQERMAREVPFAWEPHKWYSMKFRTAVVGDKAVLKGKVWEKGKPEPEEWTVEAVDESPNHVGSPGAFGNATDAELFYDNIKVDSNNDENEANAS